MPENTPSRSTPNRIQQLVADLERGTLLQVRSLLNALYPSEIAHLIESLSPEKRDIIWEFVAPELRGDVLLEVNDDIKDRLIERMGAVQIAEVAASLDDLDDQVDFLQDLPETVIGQVLQSLDAQHRQRLESGLSYEEDTAGGLMNTDTITVRPDVTLDVVQRYLRMIGSMPEITDKLFVVSHESVYVGAVSLTDLLTQDPSTPISALVQRSPEPISADTPAEEVAKLFEYRDLVSAPVVDEQGRLLGRITIDDVVDVIRDLADHSIMSRAGLNEEYDMFAPVLTSTRRRALWLGVNLITALLASWVIGLFDDTIEKLVALAVLMPIVASMGGIAGSQTLTLVVRGMALGHVGRTNVRLLFTKEFYIGVLNGLLWAVVVAGVTVLWFKDYQLGAIIAAAMTINLVTAAIAGAVIPMLIRRLGADPALAGGVVLTTVTDVIGFMAFLGLAALFLVE